VVYDESRRRAAARLAVRARRAEGAARRAEGDARQALIQIREEQGRTRAALEYLGEVPLAIRQRERALELRESKLGPDHHDTLASRNNLARSEGPRRPDGFEV
jgi:hypothetical protein